MKTGGTRGDDSTAALITPHLDSIAERTVSFDESMTGSDAKDEDMDEDYDDYLEEKAPAPAVVTPETPEDSVLSAGRSAGTRSLSRNLAVELDDDTRSVTRNLADELDGVDGPGPAYDDFEDFEDAADDSRSPVLTTQVTEQTSGNRPPLNGDTPAANKVLGRLYEEMKKSDWGELFEPTMTRQAVWADLYHELARPVSFVTGEQVAKDTERFLNALGLRPSQLPSPSTLECWVPAEAGAELWKWKKRLRTAFGVNSFTLDDSQTSRATREVVNDASVLLPTTAKRTNLENPSQKPTGRVFSASGERSPYSQDPHMVTPPPTGNSDRARRTTDDSKSYRSTRSSSRRSKGRRYQSTDDSSDEEAVFTGDGRAQTNEYLRQIHEVTEFELLNATPRIEVATHRSLGQIKAFSGTRNKSENSMQWLRAFVYEMKGTRASPNEWCMTFELSLRDGALHWYRQLPKKTKRMWSLLSEAFIKYYCSQFSQSAETRYYSAKHEDKEHVCDYLNRLNGYARNAAIRFESNGRKARDHVKRFLETCGDRGLERRLCHLRVSDIHELDETIQEILKIDERNSSRESSLPHSRARDVSRRRGDRRRDDSRRHERSEDARRREDRRRDDSRDAYNRRDRRERDYERRRGDSRNMPRVSLAEASVTDIIAELHRRNMRDARSDLRHPRHRYNNVSNSEDGSEHGSDDSQCSGEDWGDSYSSDGSDDYLAAANDKGRRVAAEAPSQSAVSEDESAAESTASSATVVLSSPELGSLAVGDTPIQASLEASTESSASLATSPAAPSDTSLVDVPVGSAAGDSVAILSSQLAARCSTSSAGASCSTTDDSLITVSREALEQIVMEVSAEASEHVIAVLGPWLDLIGRLNVTLHQGPNIRGDRHVGSRLAAAHSLEDVVAAAQPNMGVHDDINLDLAMMRGQLQYAEAARAAAENSAMKESFKHENTMVFLKQARAEFEHSKKEVKRLRVLEAHYLQEMEGLRGAVDAHTETAARLENRVRVADNECKRLALQRTREQTVFKAAVASSTAQSKRLHDLLARLDAGDDSSSTRLQRRNEDLQEQVKRLTRANRTLRARVKFEDMDPDVLVLISEGSYWSLCCWMCWLVF
ncbi:uncharacterized protein IUM83_18355 [Phytophthora cinnamomi]|uniref:uncharacterized protein n=1 Tax=Phytophthora cinnamomi TaxID=4785 RepID=UPI0035599CFA|nr:hypothetical protein IUM83_18355 [Phytophthora cinnamomi]